MPIGPTRKGAGQRRHVIQVQKPTRVLDSMGGQQDVIWSTHTTVYGAVEPQPESVFVITIPYREDVVTEQRNATQRALGAGRVFTVVEVMEPETKRRDLVLKCVEIYL